MESEQEETHNKSSEVLWNELRNGNKNALSGLFNRFYDSLFAYGYRIMPDDDQVKDAIQEVFFQLWNYKSKLATVKSVRAYLLMSLRHQLFNDKKVRQRREKLDKEYASEDFEIYVDYEKWLEILELEQEQISSLKKAIKELSPRQREVIYLKYYEGLSSEELSEIMDLRTQSIYNLLSNAIKNLQNHVDP